MHFPIYLTSFLHGIIKETNNFASLSIHLSSVSNYHLENDSFVGLSITNRLSSWTGSPSCCPKQPRTIFSGRFAVLTASDPFAHTHRYRPQNAFLKYANS